MRGKQDFTADDEGFCNPSSALASSDILGLVRYHYQLLVSHVQVAEMQTSRPKEPHQNIACERN
jgi:hypothetical protein